MIRIAICEDNESDRQVIKRAVDQVMREERKPYEVDLYADGEELLENYRIGVDILLLDIQMQSINGIAVAEKIRQFDESVQIIFITSLPNYACDGYHVRAFSFLLKPIRFRNFSIEFRAALRKIELMREKEIVIRNAGCVFCVSTSEIICLEVRDHTVTYYLDNRQLQENRGISALEKELKPKGFFRCHQSFLVNQKHIVRIENDQLIMTNQMRIPISKHRRKQFLQDVLNYVGEMI